jgi:gliding motility-associated-like protein
MLAISGLAGNPGPGGRVYVFRYDPSSHSILWNKEYFTYQTNYSHVLLQMGTGGNYVHCTNPSFVAASHMDVDLMELDKNTGDPTGALQRRYTFFGTETLYDLQFDGQFIYGIGRYKGGGSMTDFRSTIVKLNANNGAPAWTKMGHVPSNRPARLYGVQLLLDGNHLISSHFGDPDGNSFTDNELYIQKTTTNGSIVWCNKYDLPGNSLDCREIIKVSDGYIAFASYQNPEVNVVMFKINGDGEVQWAKEYHFPEHAQIISGYTSHERLLSIDDQLIFSVTGVTSTGNRDLLIVRTDDEGNVDLPCASSSNLQLDVIAIPNPAFYDVSPDDEPVTTEVINLNSTSVISPIASVCSVDTLFTEITTTICDDEIYEGYTMSGVYVDEFVSVEGCDSIRTLNLTVNICASPCVIAGSIYGHPAEDERGYSLASAENGINFYAAGLKNDSVLIVKLTSDGLIEWTRTFDIVPNIEDHVTTIIVDSDGMIGVAGTSGNWPSGGSVFAFRYNPETHQILWSKRYLNTSNNFSLSMVQKGSGGNYVLSNNPHFIGDPFIDAELIEISLATGDIIPAFAKDYHVGSAEEFVEVAYDNGFIYGVGRFTAGSSNASMRNSIVKANATDGSVVWSKSGHISLNETARLYGRDLIVDEGFIYSVTHGDPTGTSFGNVKLFVQKTTINGDLVWVKQYELPGNVDVGYEIIKSTNGYVVFAHKRDGASYLVLFKIDPNGNLLWSNEYEFSGPVNSPARHTAKSQLIQVGDQLIFTGFITTSGQEDIVIVRTDLNGNTTDPCINSGPTSVSVFSVTDPVLFNQLPDISNISPGQANPISNTRNSSMDPKLECFVVQPVQTSVSISICEGEMYESYTEQGIYVDTFSTNDGCDSFRVLELEVDPLWEIHEIKSICFGESFDGYTSPGIYVDTFQSTAGCDSVRVLTLQVAQPLLTFLHAEICQGQSFLGYTTSGMHVDTFQNIEGCDSIRTLDLEVITNEQNLDVTICFGEVYGGHDTSGFYHDTIQGSMGSCDTLLHLNLVVLPAVLTELEMLICAGGSYGGYNTTGIFIDTFHTTSGCDSVRILDLAITDTIIVDDFVQICLGQNYQGHTESGLYSDTLTSVWLCDSIYRLHLDVTIPESIYDVVICSGSSYENYTTTGIYIDTIQGIQGGCDTVRTIILTVKETVHHSFQQSICEGDLFDGYAQPGTYTDTLMTPEGCDSIRIVMLDVIEPVHSMLSFSLCDENLSGISSPGIYIDTVVSVAGCDSIITRTVSGYSTYLPNVFSPNGDGINDLYETFQFPDATLDIEYFAVFDRFGNMAYQTDRWPIQWNGTSKNETYYNPGVFAYTLVYGCGSKSFIETGNITLIR